MSTMRRVNLDLMVVWRGAWGDTEAWSDLGYDMGVHAVSHESVENESMGGCCAERRGVGNGKA